MSINDTSTPTSSESQAPRQERVKQDPISVPMSFHTGSLFGAPISRTVGSEIYSKLKNALIEIYKAADENMEIALIDLDNINEPALDFSSIIIAARFKNQPISTVSYHILLLAATGDKLTPYYENIASQQIEVLRVTSDAVDDVLLKAAQAKVRKAFPNSNVRFCDATVVPTEFNADDKYAVHQLALNAGLACTTDLEVTSKGFVDLNLATINQDSSLNVNITFNRTQISDAVGSPMRSDIQVTFSSKRNNQGGRNGSVNTGDREAKVFEGSGFTDMVWAPVAPQSTFNSWAPQQTMATQKYVPRLVITNLSSQFSYTPAAVLLGIVSMQTVREESNWVQSFRPTATPNDQIDITDIGALNIEANLTNDPTGFGIPIDTKANEFKLLDLGKLMAAMVQPGMVVSLDCPEYGPQAWYTSVFISASRGSQGAYDILYDAAESLTNGNFGKNFPRGSAMFVDQDNRVHLGTYTARNGDKHDIRDFDHVAVCNLTGERNPASIRDWSDTFLRTSYPLIQRLFARKKMISALSSETAVFTGMATRVTFSRPFLDALTAGVRATGIAVRIITPLSGSDFNDQRAVATFASSALVAPGQTFVNNGGYGFQPMSNVGIGGGYRF